MKNLSNLKTKRYSLENNTLELYVKKSPFIGRVFILLLAFISVAVPLLGMFFRLQERGSFHILFIVGLGLFSLMSFFFIRLFLWNTYGKEVIEIGSETITYYVDYHYFKGNQKEIAYNSLTYAIANIGFKEEKIGHLILAASDNVYIESAVNMDLQDLNEIIILLKER